MNDFPENVYSSRATKLIKKFQRENFEFTTFHTFEFIMVKQITNYAKKNK